LSAGIVIDEDGSMLLVTEDAVRTTDDLLDSMETPHAYQIRLDYLKRLAEDNPKVIAQVLKTWVKKDG